MGSISLTAELLKSVHRYDPETGHFVRLVTRGNQLAGNISGCAQTRGYWGVHINGRTYPAHRLAWLYIHGVWPKSQIDHVNGDRSDNRLANLREATNSQNQANRRSSAKSGYKGVVRDKSGWIAQISKDKTHIYLGHFKSPELAHAAYVAAAKDLHGEFARAQ